MKTGRLTLDRVAEKFSIVRQKLPVTATLALVVFGILEGQTYSQQPPSLAMPSTTTALTTNYTIVTKDSNSRVWQQVVQGPTNQQGQITYQTNSYTELNPGIYRWVGTNLVESSSAITITPTGGVATNAAHSVGFAADINMSNAVEIVTPEGLELKTHILGVSLFDSSTGSNVLFAELTNSTGLLIGSNEVLYPNAFTGTKMDVLYINTTAGLEQDIVINQQIPDPNQLGLSTASTRLQVWTEFFEPPQPEVVTSAAGGDSKIRFGTSVMGRGRAFIFGDESNSVSVRKQWVKSQGRTFLVEDIPLSAVAPRMQNLPAPTGATSNGVPSAHLEDFPNRLPPLPTLAKRSGVGLKVASAEAIHPTGLVMDYTLNGSYTNLTFQGDTTYLVSGGVLLNGTTTFEGGTVVKYADGTNSYYLDIGGPIVYETGLYRPAIFTSVDDNSIGSQIGSGNPVATPYTQFLILDDPSITNVSGVRCSYAGYGIVPFGNSTLTISNCQLDYSGDAIWNQNIEPIHMRNVLFASNSIGIECDQSSAFILTGENVTSDSSNFWDYSSYQPLMALTNCIISGTFITPTNLSTNCTVINPPLPVGQTLFQSAGAGNYYLATNSPYRDAGTTNIDANLLAALQVRTTYPPIVPPLFSSNNIPLYTNNVTEFPQAQRDYDTPDLGYHYDPIDDMTTPDYTNATLTLTNGVVIGYWRNLYIVLDNGSAWVSQGSPMVRNVITYYNLVQEQPVILSVFNPYQYSGVTDSYHSDSTRNPQITLNFTDIFAPQSAIYMCNLTSGYQLGAFTLQNCELYGAGSCINFYYPSGAVFDFQNNLFLYLPLYGYGYGQFSGYNNLYRGGIGYEYQIYSYGSATITNRDNAFDDTKFYSQGTYGYNGFLNGATDSDSHLATDIFTNLTWQVGPLGNFYQPTNSPLISKGSRSAAAAGLYHYTVLTDQAIEDGATNVTMGYHYVALGTNGLPLNTSGDGSDYLLDANGNGIVDPGEMDWMDFMPLLSGTQIQVYTPLYNR